MDKNICTSCGTENEAQYKYCKNCGSEVAPAQKQPESQFVNETDFAEATHEYNFKRLPKGIVTDNISGISSDEIAFFIGKKAYDILPKFSKMELSNSKVSWCWPAAILGYIFGPLGAAFWFFYRKMYKPACILSIIGAALTIVTTVLTGGIELDISALYNALTSGDLQAYMDSIGSVSPQNAVLTTISNLIDSTASILSCILCGMFSFHIYKEHCVRKINEYRVIQADKRYYKLGLASIGGVSGGMATLGVIIMILVSNVATMISTLFGMII